MYEFKHKKSKEQQILSAMSPDQRYLWEERVAICIVDGQLTQKQAERIAWDQYTHNLKIEVTICPAECLANMDQRIDADLPSCEKSR